VAKKRTNNEHIVANMREEVSSAIANKPGESIYSEPTGMIRPCPNPTYLEQLNSRQHQTVEHGVLASHHSGPLEVKLTRRNIPFVKFGGLKFLNAAHVKDLLTMLRFVQNPRDRVPASG
jgi:superfamily I DNA/RNA helicase